MAIIIKYTEYTEYLNERLYFSTSLIDTMRYLSGTKKNKVASFLLMVYDGDFYKDDEMINFIGLSKNDNMVDYSPTNKRPDDCTGRNWAATFDNPQRVSIRVGRAVKRIYDTIKKNLNYEGSTNCRAYRDRYSGTYFFDFETSDKPNDISYQNILTIPSGYQDIPQTRVSAKIKINGEDILIDGKCLSLYSYLTGCSTLGVSVDNQEKISMIPTSEGMYDASRIDEEFNIPIDIKISNNFEITDADIERFTNEFVSYVKMGKSDETSIIKEVRGEDIRFWYDRSNYCGHSSQPLGKLGNSCMSYDESQAFLDIYVDNSDKISMLILTNKANKLVGRALLWLLDSGDIFMDRVYTSSDSDDNIFINYAITKGYVYRAFSVIQSEGIVYYKNSELASEFKATVTLKYTDYEYYPYVDTLKYLIGKTLNNTKHHDHAISDDESDEYEVESIKTLTDTEGGWEEQYNDD